MGLTDGGGGGVADPGRVLGRPAVSSAKAMKPLPSASKWRKSASSTANAAASSCQNGLAAPTPAASGSGSGRRPGAYLPWRAEPGRRQATV